MKCLLTLLTIRNVLLPNRTHELYHGIECAPCCYYLGQTCPNEIYMKQERK